MNPNLKIYLFGSIWGATADTEITLELLAHLKTKGNVLSEHLFDEDYRKKEHLNVSQIHDRDLKWIGESHAMVGDVTAPSLGVGYELREGVIIAKPILCLYRPKEGKNLSAMIDGSPGITVRRYDNREQMIYEIDRFFHEFKLDQV